MKSIFATKNKPKIPHPGEEYLGLRIVSLITLSLFVLIIAGAGLFVYNTVFTTIGKVESILSFNTLAIQTIDFDRLDSIESAWDKKNPTTTLKILRDPFGPIPTETSSTKKTEDVN